jgi:hypothetical protein
MKKLVLMVAMFTVCFSVMAQEDRMWMSMFTTAQGTGLPGAGGEVDGDGFGWWMEVYDVTADIALAGENTPGNTDRMYGWAAGFGYLMDQFVFGTVIEGHTVQLRLYNNADWTLATYRIDSATVNLPDLTDPIPLESNEFTFDMSGSTWQAVPEPATFGLMALGGGIAWLVRLKQRIG